uniref:Uncharacterized protein n=1 Tax=Cannabis sativa TaxID=3483 RepID=A0A803PC22_CANSA
MRRGNQIDTTDLMAMDPNVYTPANPRDLATTDPTLTNPQPPTGPQIVGQGVTTPLAGFTLGVQETRTTSTRTEQTTPSIEIHLLQTLKGQSLMTPSYRTFELH